MFRYLIVIMKKEGDKLEKRIIVKTTDDIFKRSEILQNACDEFGVPCRKSLNNEGYKSIRLLNRRDE